MSKGSDGLSSSLGGVVRDAVTRGGEELMKCRELTGTPIRFPGTIDADAPTLLEARFPGITAKTAAEADRICAGSFDLLGYRGLSFGDPVDWRRDPISGRRTRRTHWSRIRPDDAEAVGNVRLVWELSRHGFIVTLAQAFHLTSDERYADVACRRWREWMRSNPPGVGINWTSSLEVAIRLMAWCWSIGLLSRSEALDAKLKTAIVEGITAHATHVEKYLSYYSSPNTHLTGEALGLVYAGAHCPELPAARRWCELGTSILVNESVRQVSVDGVYFEQSTGYQRYAIEIYLHLLALARISGQVVPSVVGDTVERMVEFLIALRSPRGRIPQIGDDDSGWLVPLERRAPDDLRGLFSVASVMFDRHDFAWAAEGAAPETFWLLGADGLQRADALRPAPPASPPSSAFARGGYVVMRSGWDDAAHQLIFDVGPLASLLSPAHGHADLLSVQCAAFGEPYLVDPGTYCYGGSPAWRDHFRGTAAHNTVLVDGAGQAAPAGTFAWKTQPRARLSQWRSCEDGDFADASHNAYGSIKDGVMHRRRILFAGRRYWVVVDDLDGRDAHDVELRFQLAPSLYAVAQADWIAASHPAGHGMLIGAFSSRAMRPELFSGCEVPILGWVSPRLGRRHPAPMARWRISSRLPLRIVTLLLPLETGPTCLPPVDPTFLADGRIGGLHVGSGWEDIRIDDRDVSVGA